MQQGKGEGGGGDRRDRLIQDARHDTYRARKKLPEPARCPGCEAVFRDGRWQWLEDSTVVSESLCPTCQRIEDAYPAGIVTLSGKFVQEHRDEILGLVHNVEARERGEHPLKRIMELRDQGAEISITTTDLHLARSIGDSLHHAYAGELDYQYTKEADLLRVTWKR
jgi:NMD protein affecting ribosome stability and mRNA decay